MNFQISKNFEYVFQRASLETEKKINSLPKNVFFTNDIVVGIWCRIDSEVVTQQVSAPTQEEEEDADNKTDASLTSQILEAKAEVEAPNKPEVSLFLHMDSPVPIEVCYTLTIGNGLHSESSNAWVNFDGKGSGYGFEKVGLLADLMENEAITAKWSVTLKPKINTTITKPIKPSIGYFLVEDKTFTDYTLECSGKTFKVHKVVLASTSQVFKTTFQRDSKGKSEIKNYTSEVVQKAIRLMYIRQFETFINGKPIEIPVNLALNLYHFADYYDLLDKVDSFFYLLNQEQILGLR